MIMKVFNRIMKVLLILAAIAGVIYVIAAYGERIVAWAKSLLTRLRGKVDYYYADEDFDEEFYDDETTEDDFEA